MNQSEFGIYLSALRGYTLMAEDAQRREARRQGGGNKPQRLELVPLHLSTNTGFLVIQFRRGRLFEEMDAFY